jgi:hypothetical protein
VANEREAVRASEPMLDAGRPADASEIIAVEPDAAHRSRLAHDDRPEPPEEPVASDASSSPRTPNRRGAIAIQVITRPEGAHLYDGEGHYRGPGGAQLEEPYGARLTVSCRQPGYKPGSVELRFDGTAGTALCVLERIKVCINNIKNPFDDCEIDPDAPTPAAPAIPETADAAAASVAPPTAPASGESVDAAPTPAASSPTAPAEP